MEEARTFFVATLKKLIEKSSLASSFVCYTAIFDPTILALEWMRKPILKRFKLLLKLLLDLNILSATECDQATQEFQTFMDENVKIKTLAFSSFDEETTRLDHFYFKIIMVGRYEVLSFILKIISLWFMGKPAWIVDSAWIILWTKQTYHLRPLFLSI